MTEFGDGCWGEKTAGRNWRKFGKKVEVGKQVNPAKLLSQKWIKIKQ